MAETELNAWLQAWCDDYLVAFTAFDLDAIANHWRFPALVIQGDRRFNFAVRDDFLKSTGALIAFYKQERVAGGHRSLVDAMAMGADCAAMTVEDVLRDAAGTELVRWQSSYVLHQAGGRWYAAFAVATGEAEAWAARGTPMGVISGKKA